jgi:hypothetical protein
MTLFYRHDLTRAHLAAGAREFLEGLQSAEDCHVLLYEVFVNHISPMPQGRCHDVHTMKFDEDVNVALERTLQEVAIDSGLHAVMTQLLVRIAATLQRSGAYHLTPAERRASAECAAGVRRLPYDVCTQGRMHMATCAMCATRSGFGPPPAAESKS